MPLFQQPQNHCGHCETPINLSPGVPDWLEKERQSRQLEYRYLRQRFLVSSLLTAAILFLHFNILGLSLPLNLWLQFLLATPLQFYGGWRFVSGMFSSIKNRSANMNTLIGMGTLSAYGYSTMATFFPSFFRELAMEGEVFYETLAFIITFVLLGAMLEARTRERTGEAIRKLIQLQPKTARVLRRGERGEECEIEVPIAEVNINDVLLVKPGERIPVDGRIIWGGTTIDESMMTGESMPVDKKVDDEVMGGTLNRVGSFQFRATKVGEQMLLYQMIRMVQQAQASKAPIQRLADKVSGWFTPAVIVCALLTFLVWFNFGPTPQLKFAIVTMVAVLIVACPCALGLAIPTAVTVALGEGARRKILMRGGDVLEKVGKLTLLVFDKTGTLTTGRHEVKKVVVSPSIDEQEFVKRVASLERYSEHPLAQAVVRYFSSQGKPFYEVEDFMALPGEGVTGKIGGRRYVVGNETLFKKQNIPRLTLTSELEEMLKKGWTPLFCAQNDVLVGIFAVADTVRPEAKTVIRKLKMQGLKLVLMTGDREEVARHVAQEVGVDQVMAGVLPKTKAERIQQLRQEGEIVGMIGDGINDAPALAHSDVGIAMGSGTDIAIEAASITLVDSNLKDCLFAISLSRQAFRVMKQNLFFSFFYNVLGIPLAAGVLYPSLGWLLSPVFAALAMSLSSVSVVSNSLRLRSFKGT